MEKIRLFENRHFVIVITVICQYCPKQLHGWNAARRMQEHLRRKHKIDFDRGSGSE